MLLIFYYLVSHLLAISPPLRTNLDHSLFGGKPNRTERWCKGTISSSGRKSGSTVYKLLAVNCAAELVHDRPSGGCGYFRFIFSYTGGVHRVYMSFMLRQGWHCQFLEQDLKTPLPRKLALASQGKLLKLAERGGATLDLESREAIRHAIEIGRGGVWLNLTDEQYKRLK